MAAFPAEMLRDARQTDGALCILRDLGVNRRLRRAIGRQPRSSKYLAAAGVGFLAGKAISTLYYVPRGTNVREVSFGFGDHVQSLLDERRFEWVLDGKPRYASRMPLLPLAFAGLGRVSGSMVTAALLKSFILSVFTATSIAYLLHEFSSGPRDEAVWGAICLTLCASPPVIKHASAVDYEEGFLIEFLFVWCAAFLWMMRVLGGAQPPRFRAPLTALAVSTSSASVMLKTSMAPVFLLTQMTAALYGLKVRSVASMLMSLLGFVPPVLWGLRNRRATGRFSIRTSWDGENLYRGWSSEGLALYPDVCLDRMFDASEAYTADGRHVAIGKKAEWTGFRDEWHWDEHYRTLAGDWMRSHPVEGMRFTLRKAHNLFISRKTSPYTYSVDARDFGSRREFDSLVTTAWLSVGRGLQVAMVGLAGKLWMSGRRDSRAVVLGVAAANGAYALPYLVGFNYERHVTNYLVLVAVCVAVMAGELT